MLSTLGSVASQGKIIALLDSTSGRSGVGYGSSNIGVYSSFSIDKNCIITEISFLASPLITPDATYKIKVQILSNTGALLYTSVLLSAYPTNPVITVPSLSIFANTTYRLQILLFNSSGGTPAGVSMNNCEYYDESSITHTNNGVTLTVVKGLYKDGVLDQYGGANKTLVYKLKVEA